MMFSFTELLKTENHISRYPMVLKLSFTLNSSVSHKLWFLLPGLTYAIKGGSFTVIKVSTHIEDQFGTHLVKIKAPVGSVKLCDI